MICPKCNTINDANALFCVKCETKLYNTINPETNNNKSDLLIMVFLGFLFFSEIVRVAIEKLVDNWYEGFPKYIIIVLNLLAGFSVILLGCSIKNNKLRIFGIVISLIYSIYVIYTNIDWLLH